MLNLDEPHSGTRPAVSDYLYSIHPPHLIPVPVPVPVPVLSSASESWETKASQTVQRHISTLSTWTTRTHKIEHLGPETGSVGSRGGTGKDDDIDHETNLATNVDHFGGTQQQSSAESQENVCLDSTSSTRPTSPVPATRLWETAAHGSIHCEETATGQAIHITLSKNPHNLQPSKAVPDWTRLIYTALTESKPATPFQQMHRPLSQEDMSYIRKRLEKYADEVRQHIHKLDGFDCAVILADARTLFSYIGLLESMIKTQQVKLYPKLILKCFNQHVMIPRETCDQLCLQVRRTVENGSNQRWINY
ncbi:hypothetical protein AJ78_07252 [Emergomyces pasteurianus Ep9510]|uniref:Uncharacterized protein n=1 Tax=Emergomyces pasteurianus Ep9510 TaxID=1447872 RepID=A0A1J9Q7B8_9EURO|nr:hypothetical protein AJ78_07252 [Emergomyces pasteurianus Ep9510]